MSGTQPLPGEFNMDLSSFDLSDFIQSSSMDTLYLAQHGGNGSTRTANGNSSDINAIQHNANRADHRNPHHFAPQHVDIDGSGGQIMESFSGGMIPHQQRQPPLPNSSMSPFPRGGTVTAESLKLQLQQQMRLQQLQQLQNQILQQQIELISGQSQSREMLMHGLLTPKGSEELRPTVHGDYLSPMTLQAQQYNPDSNPMLNDFASPAMTPQTNAGSMSSSQPSYQTSKHMTPMDMFSPLTSPALGPTIGAGPSNQRLYAQQHQQPEWSSGSGLASSSRSNSPQRADLGQAQSANDHASSSNLILGSSNKRPTAEDTSMPRKRLSPLIKATPGGQSSSGQVNRKTRSSRTTSRSASLHITSDLRPSVLNTPSPIDMDTSMPPPAPPAGPEPAPHPQSHYSASSQSPSMEPVTPADIMNMDHRARMPTGLVPDRGHVMMSGMPSDSRAPLIPAGPMTAQQQQLAEVLTTIQTQQQHQAQAVITTSEEAGKKGKASTAKGKAAAASSGSASGSRSTKPSPIIRPSNGGALTPKTILPSGLSAEAATELSQKSNYQTMLEAGRATPRSSYSTNSNASASQQESAKKPANGSHKAAEQKRRDSLKAGFDDLRLLLPPIIIDPDSDEPLLPGSAPPRGPQRNNLPPGAEDHPNRGVSKLALLRCSNEFIGRLNKRIERRDQEIDLLRDEVRWLREKLGATGEGEDGDRAMKDWVDLEKDLDEIEREDPNLGFTATGGKSRVTGVGVALADPPTEDGTTRRSKAPRGTASRSSTSSKGRDRDGAGIGTVCEEDEE